VSANIFFAPIRTPFVDPATGIINRQWYLFLLALFNRVGGTIAPSTDDILESVDMGIDSSTVLAVHQTDVQAINQTPATYPPQASVDDLLGELRQTRELVATLITSIQDIRQGANL
jgi:hypothetical protein